ncbi:hypothetical protein [Phenylobacterium sp. Root700]|uniref:hypothetical protein n=1 Tax=Phenylobacterium sp. Root700 TaxID=1736591 RepID=UPI0006F79F79|nr:hypothetical protein [Phenylobacterium sp. Root700]KRB42055.1 hypothetical protein ASE02_04385 [Phenylobacterium sp. Root700]
MSEDKAKRTTVSRRSMIGAAAAAPVLANAGGVAKAASLTDRCGTFVAIDIRIRRLLMRWGDLESDAAKNQNWFKLSRREQLELPQGAEMARIDKILPGLFRERRKLLEALPRSAATDPTAAAAKIAAAAKAIDPEDHEEVHFLLSGTARDMAAMRCPGCHQPLVTETWIEWSTRVDQGGKV